MRKRDVFNRGLAACLLLSLSACALFQRGPVQPVELSTQGPVSAFPIAGVATATLLPASSYVLATTRPNPGPNGGPAVFCQEPNPDWAAAFGSSYKGGANGGAGGATGGLTAEADATETDTALAGRTAGVVALRDGLYSACQAYANGVIGKDAYGLILSQYGNLLVALASAGSGTAADAAAQAGIVQQQGVQAMLVACIAHDDQSTGVPAPNQILDRFCRPFMLDFMQAVPALLKPVGGPPQRAPAPARSPPAGGKSKIAANGPTGQ
jgi:hypothetical protein